MNGDIDSRISDPTNYIDKLARPNEKYRFEFTTSSKTIKNRLGVKSD